MKPTDIIRHLNGATLWWIVCAAGMTLMLHRVLFELTFLSFFSQKNLLASAIAESVILLIPYFFLPRRLRPLMWVPLLVTPAVIIVYLLHKRAFSTLPEAESLPLLFGMDTVSVKASMGLFIRHDLMFPLILTGELLCFILWHKDIITRRFTWRVRVAALAAAAAATCCAIWFKHNMYEHRFREYDPTVTFAQFISPRVHGRPGFDNPSNQMAWQGFSPCLLTSLTGMLHPQADNSPRTDAAIARALARISDSAQVPEIHIPDGGQRRNLILIVVESWVLPSGALPEGVALMPVLSRLMTDSSAIAIDNIRIRAKVARSADGQFIYDTGLLPPTDINFLTRYFIADYPSLAKAIPNASSIEIITEPETVWHHDHTSVSCGYDRLVARLEGPDEMYDDSLLVDRALRELPSMTMPFVAKLTTGTMHEPYLNADIPTSLNEADFTPLGYTHEEYAYFARLHFTDRQIGRLLEGLSAKGLLDNTVVAIVPDHHPTVLPQSDAFGQMKAPLLIINSGMAHLPRRSDTEQTDLFPTILDIMGVRDYRHPALIAIADAAGDTALNRPYRGLGRSLFDTAPRPDTTALRIIGSHAVTGRTFRHR